MAQETLRGRVYKKKTRRMPKDRGEWIAVPVPYAGIPREVVEVARRTLERNKASSKADDRVWELSGGVFRCGHRGRAIATHATYYRRKSGEKARYHYYRCQNAATHKELCPYRRSYKADGLEEMIRREESRGGANPREQAKPWQDKIVHADQKRKRYQEMAAEGLIDFGELRERLAVLNEDKEVAEREVESLLRNEQRLEALRRNKDELSEDLSEATPRLIDGLPSDQKLRI